MLIVTSHLFTALISLSLIVVNGNQKQKPYLDIASISDGNVAVRSMVDYYNEKIDNLVKAVEILKKSE